MIPPLVFKSGENNMCQEKIFDIEEELKKLPHKPGVYIMHSASHEILYVGKAVDLHNRVRQYFRNGHGHNNSPKIIKMVSQIDYFEYILTSSEVEALVLECNLIKEHHPKYNTMMTDDKGYPYIQVTVEKEYPQIMYSHNMKNNKSKYFGPYTNVKAVKDIIELVNKLFFLRTCNKNLPKEIGKERPCLYYQIGQCKAPCAGYISKEEYLANVNAAMDFLNGNYKPIEAKLVEDMKQYAEELEFEKAAKTRDLISGINHIMNKQKMSATNTDDRDVIAFAINGEDAVVTVFFIRQGKLLGRENHHMKIGNDEEPRDLLASFIKQFYIDIPFVPKEIVVGEEVNDAGAIEEMLSRRRGSMVNLFIPQKGDKKKLLELAYDNAKLVLNQDIERMKRKEKRTTLAVGEIADALGIKTADRMEAYDISNISGTLGVASMVVFEKGEPKRKAYRKFRLQTVDGPDDYASMKEVLSRRFTDDNLGPYPDVIMMDGGKGQINVALMVLDSLGIDIPVCGMVKDDNHRTRALYYDNREVVFPKGSEAMLMVTALQDEAHRFAIEYHKQLRSKHQVKSILDEIPGVGPARRKSLLLHFKDVEHIQNATLDELLKAPDIPASVASYIYQFFHKTDEDSDENHAEN